MIWDVAVRIRMEYSEANWHFVMKIKLEDEIERSAVSNLFRIHETWGYAVRFDVQEFVYGFSKK